MNTPTNLDLMKAIAAAQAEARTLNSSEPGHDDVRERAWYYPPSEAVHAEVRRLCGRHGLAIVILSATTCAKGQIATHWQVTHLATGQMMDVQWDTDPMPDLATKAHGIGGAVRHAQRFMPLVLFAIPARPRKRGEKVDAAGAIVSDHQAPTVGGVVDDDIPWAPVTADASDGTGGGLVDPGPLGGEDPEPADHDPIELAAEADAAALGQVDPTPDIDATALLEGVRRWGKATGHGGKSTLAEALKQAHGGAEGDWNRAPITGSPEALARRGRLVALLREGGHLS